MVYSGYMDLGIRQGFGVLSREDGSIAYEGEWKNNVQDGKGKSFSVSGLIVYEGDFLEGSFFQG